MVGNVNENMKVSENTANYAMALRTFSIFTRQYMGALFEEIGTLEEDLFEFDGTKEALVLIEEKLREHLMRSISGNLSQWDFEDLKNVL